jgi:hypothetical protein
MLETTDNAVVQYQQALQELKQLADQRDFTPEGEKAYYAKFLEVKHLYLAACPPDCTVEVTEKSGIQFVDDKWHYTPPAKSDNRLQLELTFAMYITGCLAHAGMLDLHDQTDVNLTSTVRIIAACLRQLPSEDAPELPFDW